MLMRSDGRKQTIKVPHCFGKQITRLLHMSSSRSSRDTFCGAEMQTFYEADFFPEVQSSSYCSCAVYLSYTRMAFFRCSGAGPSFFQLDYRLWGKCTISPALHCKNKLVVLTTQWLPWLQSSWREWLREVCFGIEV